MLRGQDLKKKMLKMRTGERFVYHTGDLQFERQYDKAVRSIAKAAWDGYENGLVTLVQRRVANKYFGMFEYLMVRL